MAAPRILILEDDDNLRDVLAEVLSDEGFEVKAVARGETAVECAARESFDLIIADIRMEGIGGLEALEQTQKLQPNIGSLIVSGYATEHETARAERLQVGAYLTKPFKMQELLGYVRAQLADRVPEAPRSEEDLVREILDWSLTSLARVIDDTGAIDGSLLTAAESAVALCRQFHQSPEVVRAARWATIVHGSQNLSGLEKPSALLAPNRQFPELREILTSLSTNPQGEDLSTAVQTVAMALIAHVGADRPRDAESLSNRFNGRFRGDLIEALTAQDGRPVAKSSVSRALAGQEAPKLGSLASLGRTLERIGDKESARKAYLALAGNEAPTRERLAGLLGLARLAISENKAGEARTLCIKALRLSRSVGPTSLVQFGLEAALYLQQTAAPEAEEALRAVDQAADSMGLGVKRALISYALSLATDAVVGQEVVKTLLSPASANELAPYVDWFIPTLLRRAETAEGSPLEAVLLQLLSDFPRRFLHWFEPTHCPPEQRTRVARILASARYLPDLVLEQLESDPEPSIREAVATVKARQEGGPRTQILRVHSFGPLELVNQGEVAPESLWKTRKIKFLFAYLASRWGKPIAEDHIIEAFWPKDNTKNKNNLYWGTTTLRGALRTLNPHFETALVRVHDTLSLHPEFPRWHDLEEFEKAATEGLRLESAGDIDTALGHLRLAGRVYRGPYLEGCYHDFALEVREKMETTALEVYLKAAQLSLRKSEDEEAAEHARSAVELAPYRQDAHALQMRALIRLNRGTQVIELFHKLEKNLRLEYELEPTTELLELYHRARLGYTDA